MTHWHFVAAAYAVTIILTLALIVWAFLGMRRAEAAAAELSRR